MENLAVDIVNVIYQLLTGFITAGIFYLLTSYIKPDPFERIIQALIFTVIVKVLVIFTKNALLFIGIYIYTFGSWSDDLDFIVPIIVALILGLVFAICANNDFPFKYLREITLLFPFKFIIQLTGKMPKTKKGLENIILTNKTLYPSEWFSFFIASSFNSYAILHLEGERRLYGFLNQFPDSPEKGHFIINDAAWILDDGSIIPLTSVQSVLINSKEVMRVELLKNKVDNEMEVENQYKPLFDLYKNALSKQEAKNDDQCAEKTD